MFSVAELVGPPLGLEILVGLLQVLIGYLLYRDANRNGRNAILWAIVGLGFGILGFVAYLLYDYVE